jgi:hypothetical protein
MLMDMKRLARSVLTSAFLGHLAASALLFVFPWLLMTRAETGGGRLVGGGALLLLCALLSLWILRIRRARISGLFFFACFLFAGISLLTSAVGAIL